MNKVITINETKYELITNYKDGFDLTEVTNKYTDYYDTYDYLVGDWSYGKLRLKGFCDRKNKNYKNINDFHLIDQYIKEFCAYECKYFVLQKKGEEK